MPHTSFNIGHTRVSGVAMKSSLQALFPEILFDENSPECSGQSSRIVRAPAREEREKERKLGLGNSYEKLAGNIFN